MGVTLGRAAPLGQEVAVFPEQEEMAHLAEAEGLGMAARSLYWYVDSRIPNPPTLALLYLHYFYKGTVAAAVEVAAFASMHRDEDSLQYVSDDPGFVLLAQRSSYCY